ncbi:MAG: protein-disulfide reductase DsbD domain-containing protein, partial [Bacteroidota bacterium]
LYDKFVIYNIHGILPPVGLVAQNSIVNWSFSTKKISDKEYEVRFTPSVETPWHIYSQASPEGGALPTKITFSKNPLIVLKGKVKEEGKLTSKYEEVFGVTVKYFEGKVDFVQTVQLKSKVKTNITGTIEFMACKEEQCLPPKTISFNVTLN